MANKIGKLMVWKLNFMTSCDIISDTTCNRSIASYMHAVASYKYSVYNYAYERLTGEIPGWFPLASEKGPGQGGPQGIFFLYFR